MGNTNAIKVALCLSLASGCAAPAEAEPVGDTVDPARPHAAVPRKAPPDVITWTTAGKLVVVDGASGAIRREVAASQAHGERDLAWDPWGSRLVVYQGDDDEGGEIASYPALRVRDGWLLGARAHLAWVDGRARLMPAPQGVVVFEEGYGERWKLLGASPAPSVSALPPQSAWISISAGSTVVHGFALGSDGLERRAAVVTSKGIEAPSVQPISVGPAMVPATARLVPAPALAAGDSILLDVSGANLVVRPVAGGAAGPATFVPLPAAGMRIEAAVPLRGGEVVALLMSGVPQVTAVAVGPSGFVWSAAHLSLAGDVAPAPRFFSRDLVAQGSNRLLAATSAGVQAVRVIYDDDSGVHLAGVAEFNGAALRGPIAVIELPPG
ncbi:MAG: hypothetical protein QM820_47415 [Minicystis sp.]